MQRVIIIILCGFCFHLMAETWEHLGAPPPGFAYLRLVRDYSHSVIQFTGTVDPPTLRMNGQPLKLKKFIADRDKYIGKGLALWLNGIAHKSSGKIGRFFIPKSTADFSSPFIELVMRNAKGQLQKASIDIKWSFSGFSSKVKKILEEDSTPSKIYPISFEGKIPKGSELSIENAEVISKEDNKVTVQLEVPVGKTILVGRLKQADGASRVISVSINLEKISHQPDKTILSLRVPKGSRPEQAWIIPKAGTRIEGISNPGARLLFDDQEVLASSTGKFSLTIVPEEKHWESEIIVRQPDGTEPRYYKLMKCGNCDWTWYSPRPRKRGDVYLLFTPLAEISGFMARDFSNSFGIGSEKEAHAGDFPPPQLNLGAGWYLEEGLNVEACFKFGIGGVAATHKEGDVGMVVDDAFTATFGISWAPISILSLGTGFLFSSSRISLYTRTGPGYRARNDTLFLMFTLQARLDFGLASDWEFTPRLVVAISELQLWRSDKNYRLGYMALEITVARLYL